MKKILSLIIVALAVSATTTNILADDTRDVPDSGSTVAIMGLASAGLFGVRSFLKRK